MRIKLDENIGTRGVDLLRRTGSDVATVVDQSLCSASDVDLIEVCRREGRILVSLDKDFSDVTRFPPARYAGIVVLRLSDPVSRASIENALSRLTAAAAERSPARRLWIIDELRSREFGEDMS